MRLAPTELSGSEIRECTLCRRFRCFLVILAAVISILARPTDSICAAGEGLIPITLPEGKAGIGFDDLGFSSTLHKVLVPSGRTGTLDLVDPDTKQVSSIRGFTGSSRFGGGHGQGITSVDEGRGLLFVTDRTAGQLPGCWTWSIQKHDLL